MSRQVEQKQEQKSEARNKAVGRALEYGLEGAINALGFNLLGYAFTFDEWSCFMVIKAEVDERRLVSFVNSDTVTGCILKAQSGARGDRLSWGADKYFNAKD